MNTYTIGQLAKLSHVSTRTLRHYDELGLLRPSQRTESGYRLYSDGDATILAEVLLYKELEIPLDTIKLLVKGADRSSRLLEQRSSLILRKDRISSLVHTIDKMLESERKGVPMATDELFNGFQHNEHEDEAKERWGHTDAWTESNRRTKSYTADDWNRYKTEAAAINAKAVELMNAGGDPTSPEAIAVAEEHRQSICTWFYNCPLEMHSGLADMYVADPRFKKTYEGIAPGLAQWIHDAIKANSARA